MRKLFSFNLITLDGFFEGPNQDISWHNVDEEFNEFAIAQLDTIGTIVFGRITYQGMAELLADAVRPRKRSRGSRADE